MILFYCHRTKKEDLLSIAFFSSLLMRFISFLVFFVFFFTSLAKRKSQKKEYIIFKGSSRSNKKKNRLGDQRAAKKGIHQIINTTFKIRHLSIYFLRRIYQYWNQPSSYPRDFFVLRPHSSFVKLFVIKVIVLFVIVGVVLFGCGFVTVFTRNIYDTCSIKIIHKNRSKNWKKKDSNTIFINHNFSLWLIY